MWVSPMSISAVTECLQHIGEQRLSGVIHLSGDDDLTYWELAKHWASLLGHDTAMVEQTFARPAATPPVYASLDNTESKQYFQLHDLSYQQTLNTLYQDYR